MKIAFLDRGTFSRATQLRPPRFEHELVVYERTEPAQLMERIADAEVVIVNKVKIGADAIAQAPRLKMIAVAATGVDNIDIGACRERGVRVSNVREYAARTVPEHTFALIFSLRRNICAYVEAVNRGQWQDAGSFCFLDYPIRDLAGSTIGIVGDGFLGKAVASMARALGMQVLIAAHKGRTDMGSLYTPFEEVLALSDVITLHCPLLPSTRNMIGAAEFAQMKRRPLLINTARGGLVDESAVGKALEDGLISGAGFDVVTSEPPDVNHPFMKLAKRPDFILTPHIAWASDQAQQHLADQVIVNLEALHAGAPIHLVA